MALKEFGKSVDKVQTVEAFRFLHSVMAFRVFRNVVGVTWWLGDLQ